MTTATKKAVISTVTSGLVSWWPQRTTLRQLLLVSALILILLLTLRSAIAVTLTSFEAPGTIAEGSTATLSFQAAEADGTRILKDGALLVIGTSGGASTAWTPGYDDAGLVIFTFEAWNATTTVTEERTVEVLDTPLVVTLSEPATSDHAQSIIDLAVTTNIPTDLCYVVSGTTSKTLEQLSPRDYQGNLSLADGVHLVVVKCKRGQELAEQAVTLRVDTVPPSIALAPSGIVTEDQPLLVATTDETAQCRYAMQPLPFSSMERFATTGGMRHEQPLSPVEGSYRYEVTCADVYGNEASAATEFTLQLRPTASIEVEGENPRRAGRYEAILTASKPLLEKPTLTLVYQGGSSSALALEQIDATHYRGLIIVPENGGVLVGSFSFKGKDHNGLEGTRITDGELFIVDTVKPAKVTVFKAVNGTGGAKLAWYYDAEQGVRFNIYRSDRPGVTYADFLSSTDKQEYLDNGARRGVDTYYRIAAVDAAGNVGELSHEEYASVAPDAVATLTLPVDLERPLADRLRAVERLILDAERVIKDLEGESDAVKSGLIRTFGLLDEARGALTTLRDERSSLEGLRSSPLTPSAFQERLAASEETARLALEKLPVTIMVKNRAEYEEVADDAAISRAVAYALRDKTLSSSDTYALSARRFQEEVTVTSSVTQASFLSLGGNERRYTLLERRIKSAAGGNAVGIEVVPKEVSPRASDLLFLGTRPTILEEDPVLLYGFNPLTETTIRYAVPWFVDIPQARAASFVALPKHEPAAVQPFEAPASTPLLGSFLSIPGVTGGQGLLFLFGVIIIVGLLTYYLRLSSEQHPVVPPARGERQSGEQQEPPSFASATGQRLAGGGEMIRTVLITRTDEPLSSLLVKGHALIDDARHADALYFYKASLARYGTEPLSGSLTEAVRSELRLLHAKLLLSDAMTKAHDAAVAGDGEALRSLMEVMRSSALLVGDNRTKLVEKAKSSYPFLFGRLRAIASGYNFLDDTPLDDPSVENR